VSLLFCPAIRMLHLWPREDENLSALSGTLHPRSPSSGEFIKSLPFPNALTWIPSLPHAALPLYNPDTVQDIPNKKGVRQILLNTQPPLFTLEPNRRFPGHIFYMFVSETREKHIPAPRHGDSSPPKQAYGKACTSHVDCACNLSLKTFKTSKLGRQST
jgi:hypothetical protein